MLSLVILAGGSSSRMGQDKALMSLQGRPLIQHVLERLAPMADEVLLSANSPDIYSFLHLEVLPDEKPGQGALGGLFTTMKAAKYPFVAAVGCDMPFANRSLFEYELDSIVKTGANVVIPATAEGLEPLHAIYRRESCLPAIRSALEAGNFQLIGWLKDVEVLSVPPQVIVQFDPMRRAFRNLNTAEEFLAAAEEIRSEGR